MKPTRKRRLRVVLLVFAVAVTATILLLFGMRHDLNHYYSLAEIHQMQAQDNDLIEQQREIRIGGIVAENSLVRDNDSLDLHFKIRDLEGNDITVYYTGITPDLFKEGKGVLVTGHLNADNTFSAKSIFAKHDENYVPPEVKSNLDLQRNSQGK